MPLDFVRCSTHGPSAAAFVCRHLVSGEGLGFVFDDESLDPWPEALCAACAAEPEPCEDAALERIRLVCARCWEGAYERHTKVAPADDAAWLDRAARRATVRQDRWTSTFAIEAFRRYQYSFEDDDAWIAFGDGASFHVRCDAMVIGSWSRRGGTWLWGWANDHWDEHATRPIVRVKRHGEREGLRALSRSLLAADEARAWELAAATLDLLPELEGVYRAPDDDGSLFVAVTGTERALQ